MLITPESADYTLGQNWLRLGGSLFPQTHNQTPVLKPWCSPVTSVLVFLCTKIAVVLKLTFLLL